MQFQLGLAKPGNSNSNSNTLEKEESSRNPLHVTSNESDYDVTLLANTAMNTMNTLSTFSSTLSTIWAKRLNAIDPTQGRLEIQKKMSISTSLSTSSDKDPQLNSPMKIRPKWPDFLIDTSFDVIKVNKFGQKMRRTIKLTQHHVISIKNGSEITKFYAYSDIRVVWLENKDTIRIQQRSNKMNVYMSPIAPHVLQQITTRVKVRTALDKAEISDSPLTSLGYSPDVIAGIIKSISEDNSSEAEQVMALFANDLRERTVRALSIDDRSSSHRMKESFSESVQPTARNLPPTEEGKTGEEKENHDDSLNGSRSEEEAGEEEDDNLSAKSEMEAPPELLQVTNTSTPEKEPETQPNGNHSELPEEKPAETIEKPSPLPPSKRPNPKFMSFTEGMPEYIVQKTVRNIIFDESSPEGNTRKIFVESFASSQSSTKLLDVRHFIDGMHSHFIEHRGAALCL
eukprot:gene25361-27479_t